MPGNRKRERLKTAWMDNVTLWTGLKLDDAIWKVNNISEWRTTIHSVAYPRHEDGHIGFADTAGNNVPYWLSPVAAAYFCWTSRSLMQNRRPSCMPHSLTTERLSSSSPTMNACQSVPSKHRQTLRTNTHAGKQLKILITTNWLLTNRTNTSRSRNKLISACTLVC